MDGTDFIVDRRYSHRATAVDHLPIIIVGAGEPGLDPYDRVRQLRNGAGFGPNVPG